MKIAENFSTARTCNKLGHQEVDLKHLVTGIMKQLIL
jgi:hypothetical protein